jgi:hypothetical protein
MGCDDIQYEPSYKEGREGCYANSSYADMHSKFVNKKTNMGGQHVLLLDAK